MAANKKSLYQFWGKKYSALPKLDLIAIQKDSFKKFLTEDIKRGLEEVSPIEDFTGKNFVLHFGEFRFDNPQYTPSEAVKKGVTYDAPLKVQTRLIDLKKDKEIKEEVFLGDIPQMTAMGTFIINGIERAVVSQLVRSPGAFFLEETDRITGRSLAKAEVRPLRGSWLEFEIQRRDIIVVRIDRHRKFPVTLLLRAIGFSSDEEILKLFADCDTHSKHLYIPTTLEKDSTKTTEEALIEFYQKMRPGEPAILENAQELLHNFFFDARRYDLGTVGRFKLNKKLNLNIPNNPKNWVLTKEDLIGTVRYLINLQNGQGKVDDIDHLSNRRLRCVGELVYSNAFRIGLYRLERAIREKMSISRKDFSIRPSNLVNARPMIAVINQFFRRNRLSTIIDQTNPLSEIDNLCRLSVMGSGGVTRERASFSMRDINSSQYGRICPVRSPEGPNIGLVTYLALYARVNEYGFLETPYRRVKKVKSKNKIKMKVTDEIDYLMAEDEEEYHITHQGVKIDKHGFITDNWVPVRYQGEFLEAPVEQVEYIDLVPRQVFGASASLIPFLSHDEANRALMGTHMQCQAVPLVSPEAPDVGTGMEPVIAQTTGRMVRARHAGKVIYVDGEQIVIRLTQSPPKHESLEADENIHLKGKEEIYNVKKFVRSSQNTCYAQRPVVSVGNRIKKGDIIIEGPSVDNGALALGRNLVIAYVPFEGLGYEDAIVISDRLVKEDVLTSIQINEYEAELMETKLGPEELTRDIPNVSEKDLRNLTEEGIVAVGSNVGPNDILVGKIAPKGETELTAEERLLRAIFGEKAREVRDTSLRMPHGDYGTVIDVRVLSRQEGDELNPGTIKKIIVKVAKLCKISVGDKLAGRHGNKGVISKIIPTADMPFLADGTPVDIIISPVSVLARMNLGQLLEAHLGLAAEKLKCKLAIPVFEKIPAEKMEKFLKKAKLPIDGKLTLFDGRTGLPFSQKSVVGIAYVLKLIHMVSDKKHARSTGPYSLVTQQPLGGKAQMGGQRLGEMEVWALEAHRAAHNLQEMLTIKSDDVVGRAKAFEAIVKGLDIPEAKVPESFKVLVRELKSLCLNVIPTNPETEQAKESLRSYGKPSFSEKLEA